MKKILLTLLTLLIILGVSTESNEVHAEDELPGMRNGSVIIP